MRILTPSFLVALVGASCGIDNQPVPDFAGPDEFSDREPEPNADQESNDDSPAVGGSSTEGLIIDPTRIVHSGAQDGTGPRLIVGLPDAVRTVGEIQVEVVGREDVGRRTRGSRENGSFALSIDAAVGATLRIALIDPATGQLTDATTVLLQAPPSDVTKRSSSLTDVINSQFVLTDASNNRGIVTISIPAGGPLMAVSSYVVANITSGLAVTVHSDDDGSFALSLDAQPGDQLEVFAFDRDASNGAGRSTTIEIPK